MDKHADFMEPQITDRREWLVIDGPQGSEYLDLDDIDPGAAHSLVRAVELHDPQSPEDRVALSESFPELKDYFRNDKVWEAEIITGYGARLSASGYLDRTEWVVFDTPEEAEAFLEEMYGDDDFDEEACEYKASRHIASKLDKEFEKAQQLLKDAKVQLRECAKVFTSLSNDLGVRVDALDAVTRHDDNIEDGSKYIKLLDKLDKLHGEVEMAVAYVEAASEAAK